MADLFKIYEDASSYYSWVLHNSKSEAANKARKYLASRGLNTCDAKNWGLGFASKANGLSRFLFSKGYSYEEMSNADLVFEKDKTGKYTDRFFNRIMFPISNVEGQICGFGGRALNKDNPAKYLNTAKTDIFDKSNLFYGLNKITQKELKTNNNEVYVVEGYTDVISMHKAGFTSTVATLGTALTSNHLKHFENIKPRSVVLMFDGDIAGQKALDRTLKYIREIVNMDSIKFKGLVLPENLDPKEYIDKYGATKMKNELDCARDIIEIKIDNVFKEHDLSVGGECSRAAERCCCLLANVQNVEKCSGYCKYIGSKLNFGMPQDRTKLIEEELTRQTNILQQQRALKKNYVKSEIEYCADDRNAGASRIKGERHNNKELNFER